MKLRKLIAMGLAAIMAVSAMSISAFAEDISPIEGEAGVPIILYEDIVPVDDLMPMINEPFGHIVPISNIDGTNGSIILDQFTLPTNHTKITVTLTGVDGGIRTANLALYNYNTGKPIKTYDYYGESSRMAMSPGDSFTYTTTDNTKTMTFIIKGSTFDSGTYDGDNGYVYIKVVSQ